MLSTVQPDGVASEQSFRHPGSCGTERKPPPMAHVHPLTWRQDSATTWCALEGDTVLGTIVLERQYELASVDGAVRGSHSALGSAQAQLEAWYQWSTSSPGDGGR
ncbi:hypothetical protein GCM10009706_11000 [Curtobacterium citreum]|nr:hypothetical protein DEU32_10132 [Curtobacterium sp. AG1037]TQJ27053.1 hypothetical protein FB462_0900 [Curtobacterium citreum]GGL74344.1 hypothetical protein GCM10009706_11000 [Curtobacterium citreum]